MRPHLSSRTWSAPITCWRRQGDTLTLVFNIGVVKMSALQNPQMVAEVVGYQVEIGYDPDGSPRKLVDVPRPATRSIGGMTIAIFLRCPLTVMLCFPVLRRRWREVEAHQGPLY